MRRAVQRRVPQLSDPRASCAAEQPLRVPERRRPGRGLQEVLVPALHEAELRLAQPDAGVHGPHSIPGRLLLLRAAHLRVVPARCRGARRSRCLWLLSLVSDPAKWRRHFTSGFKDLLAGSYDDLPEQAFYMVGGIEEVQEKAAAIAAEIAD